MNNSYQKIASIVLYILFAIGVVFGVLFYVGGSVPGTAETGYPEPNVTSSALILSYIYFIIAAAIAIVLPMIFTQPGKSKSTLVALAAFLVIMIISYIIAPGSPMEGITMSKVAMKFIDGGLISCYILLGIAFIGVVYSEVSSFFK